MWKKAAILALSLLLCLLLSGAAASGGDADYEGVWQASYKTDGIAQQSTITLDPGGSGRWVISLSSMAWEVLNEPITWYVVSGSVSVVVNNTGEYLWLIIDGDRLILQNPSGNGEDIVFTREGQEATPAAAPEPPVEEEPALQFPCAWTIEGEGIAVTIVLDEAGIILANIQSDGKTIMVLGEHVIEDNSIIAMPGTLEEMPLSVQDGELLIRGMSNSGFIPVEPPQWYDDMREAQTTPSRALLGAWVSQADDSLSVTFCEDGALLLQQYGETLATCRVIQRGSWINGIYNDEHTPCIAFCGRVIAGDEITLDAMFLISEDPAYNPVTHEAILVKGVSNSERGDWEFRLDGDGGAVITACNILADNGVLAVPQTIKDAAVVGLSDSLFAGRNDLITITLPDGLKWIGDGVFRDCAALTKVYLPSSLERVGARAFSGCVSLTEAALPFGVSALGADAFAGCTAITSLTIPGTSDTISVKQFSGYPSLQRVIILEGVTVIQCWYDDNLPRDLEIYLPRSMQNIGEMNAFQVTLYAYEDAPVYIRHRQQFDPYESNNAVWNIRKEYDVQSNIMDVSEFTIARLDDSTCVIVGYTGQAAELAIPGEIDRLPVVEIGEEAFIGNHGLISVVIPQGVRTISASAFRHCVNLESVAFPATLEEIGERAFYGCESLKSVELPEGLRVVGDYAFHISERSCFDMQAYVGALPGSLEVIGARAFVGCRFHDTALVLHENLLSVGSHAFYNTDINSVEIRSARTQLHAPFYGSYINSATLPEGMKALPDNLFFNCVLLREVYNMQDIERIGNSAFKGCNGIRSIQIPPKVVSIGVEAFANCQRLSEVFLPDGCVTIEQSAFSNCDALREITLPANMTRIEAYTFSGCDMLAVVNLPANLTFIGASAFERCAALREVTIVPGVEIAPYAFSGCDNLTVYLPDDAGLIQWAQMYGVNFVTEQVVAQTELVSEPIDRFVGTWAFDAFFLNTGTADVIAFTDDYRFQYGEAEGDSWERSYWRQGQGTYIYYDGNIILTLNGEKIVCPVNEGRNVTITFYGREYKKDSSYNMPAL